jgi:DNA-binding response OmpR family regulator
VADDAAEPEVLVVDDSLTVRMDIAGALARGGLRSRLCATLAEARAALREAWFPLVILDVVLPDGDGVDLLRQLRGAGGEQPAVALLSTEAEVRDRIRGLETGADEYIGKPYDAGYVVARARELVRRRRGVEPTGRDVVLVIDDSPTFRAEVARALTAAGWQVETAETGEEGLRVAADLRPAAVVVDGELPGIDGPSVVRRLRLDAALRTTPCLLLTASEGPTAELRALEAGADAFLRKEGDPARLLTRLSAMLRSTSGGRRGRATSSLLGPKRILVADAHPAGLDALGDALRGEGHDVVIARSGEAALELLHVQPVDCVLLAMDLPPSGGPAACRDVRAIPALRETPVVLVTTTDDHEAMVLAFESGADDCVARALELPVLRARVAAQIRRKQVEDEARRAQQEVLERELQAAETRAARELAETRAALLDDLARKNEELEAFSYSVSHDLRAPLRAIRGFSAALLEDHADELSTDARDLAARVRDAAARMDGLIEDLLRLSRIGRAPLHRRPVDLSAIARNVAAELARAAPSRRVVVDVEDGLVADADPGLVRVVLDNLLGNAWKFTARAEVQRITVGSVPGNVPPAFRVSDTGAGFDMAHAARLFSPFKRLHAAGMFEGTGIGLATVRRVIERHGGRIWAESAVGAGATFSFTLEGKTPPALDDAEDRGDRD